MRGGGDKITWLGPGGQCLARRNKWTAGVLDQKQSTEKGWV